MTNDTTRKTLSEDINNFRLKAKFYESLHLFEAAKYAGSLAANLELALTTMPADEEKQVAQQCCPARKSCAAGRSKTSCLAVDPNPEGTLPNSRDTPQRRSCIRAPGQKDRGDTECPESN